MNGYQVPEYIKKGKYHIMTEEERKEHDRKLQNRDVAVKLLTILMTADQPLTAGEVLARVRAWLNKRDKENRDFYFYWGQMSFKEYLDWLTMPPFGTYGFLDRIEKKTIVKYQASKFGLKRLEEYRTWLEQYLGETFEEIKQSFPPLPTK